MFDEVLQNIRKATEASLKMQQELLQQAAIFWPAFPTPQSICVDKLRDLQKQTSSTISNLVQKHRQALDRQQQALQESLDEALRTAESSNPVEFRLRAEQLCRKTLECLREVSETQLREFHDALGKWTELATKAGT